MTSNFTHIRRIILIWVIATVIGIAVVLQVHLPTHEASGQAADVTYTLAVFTVLAVPIFMLVIVFGGYSVFAFRSRGMPTEDGAPIRGNTVIQTLWIIVSGLLCLGLVVYGLVYLQRVSYAAPSGALVVKVTGEQWQWHYTYPQYGGVQSTTLMLPLNQPVEFDVTSLDVDHSFWIHAFGVKIDAIPGETTTTVTTPNRLGTYDVRCVELCGLYHAYMQGSVTVVNQKAFAFWIAGLQQGGRA